MSRTVMKGVRHEKIIDVLRTLGGKATARKIAQAAIDRGDVFTPEEIANATENWATKTIRQELKKPLDDGVPSAIQNVEYVIKEDGNTTEEHFWYQREIWNSDIFMSSIREEAKGVEKDISSIVRKIQWGAERWPSEDWGSFQREFPFL